MSAEFFRKFSILLISNHLGSSSAISSLDQNCSLSHICPNSQSRHNSPISQRYKSPISQRHSSPISQRHNSPISQRHRSPISQRHKIRGSKIQPLVLLGQCSSTVHRRDVFVLVFFFCPGRRTRCNGYLPLSCAEA